MGDDAAALKEKLAELQKERTELEKLIKDKVAYLKSTPVGLKGSLIDEEGFPKADVDHYAVREARHKLACAENDLKAVQTQMFETLQDLHQLTRDGNAAAIAPRPKVPRTTDSAPPLGFAPLNRRPFLEVAEVASNSPASEAGLKVGDQLVRFATIEHKNFEGLPQLAEMTRDNEDTLLLVDVVRAGELKEMTLVPHRWAGAGLLGCVLVEL